MDTRRFSILVLGFSLLFTACRGDDEKKLLDIVPANKIPIARLKGPVSVNPGTKVTLDASGSSDPDGENLTFLWTESFDNPPNNFLDDVDFTGNKLTFVPDATGTFEYTVQVQDGARETATASIKLTVKEGAVNGATNNAPTATALVINGISYPLPGAPTVFTTATAMLDVRITGSDTEESASALTQQFSANVTLPSGGGGKRFSVAGNYNAAQDDDGFAVRTFTATLKDSDGAASGPFTVNVRVVPAANSDLTPMAVFVDCASVVDGDGLTRSSPRNTLQGGYGTAVSNAIADVWVALGTCAGAQVDFTANVKFWGLFEPANNWRRRTEPADRAADKLAGAGHKHAVRTTIQDPTATRLVYTNGTGSSPGSLKMDGFSFNLTGANLFAVSFTTPASDTVRLDFVNNEFVGNVTKVTSTIGGVVPGGVWVSRGSGSTGSAHLLRNLFAVGSAGNTSHMQVHVYPPIYNSGSYRAYISFFSNVFAGTVTATPYYKCSPYTTGALKNPFAFCLYSYPNLTDAVLAGRNTFWAQAETSYSVVLVNPVVVSSGMGRMRAVGNIFSSMGSPYKITAAHDSDDGVAGPDGTYLFNAYPVTSSSGYLFVTNYSNGRTDTPILFSATGYSCLSGTSFGNGGPPCASPVANQVSTGSIEYDPLTVLLGSNQPWRFSATVFKDLFTVADVSAFLPAEGMFDFDGVYGPIDNTALGTPKFNAGAFEVLP